MQHKILMIAFLLFFSLRIEAQEKEVLTNESIVALVELGMSSDIIIAKIITSDVDFTLDIKSLQDLKDNNVSSEIIKTMITHNHKSQLAESEKTGIYIVKDNKESEILPSVFSASKTRTLASGLTYGIASAKVKSILNGEKSDNVVKQDSIEFAFYFSEYKDNQLNATDWWFRTTTSPKEFVLVKLTVKQRKSTRELETGKVNLWIGADAGIDNEEVIKCEITQIKEGQFRVKPIGEVPIGEYCFFFAGKIPQGGFTNQSVFDFSVQ